MRLFVERARDVRPEFDLTDDNAGAVAEICARLDGLPLTIELAVARLELFSPHELRDRLRDHLEPLSGGSRDLPARQRTLSGTIEWSERLLDPDERTILRVLSVFSSASIDAVERVAAEIDELHGVSVPDGLLSLTAKSLVRSIEVDGRRRLSMLETIRQYAAERLEEEPALEKTARRAHAEHFSQLAQERRGDLSGDGRSDALDELETELGNLTTAWRYWVHAGDLGRLDMLLDGLWALHDDRGWYHGAVGLTNDLLAVLSTSPSTPERAREEVTIRTSLARGLMATRGYTEEVEEAFGRALAHLEQESAATPETLPLLRSLASLYLYRGEFDKGVAIGRQLLELAEELRDTSLEVEGHVRVGTNLVSIGEAWEGLEHLDRAIELFDPHQHVAGRFRLGRESRRRPAHDVGVRALVAGLSRPRGRARRSSDGRRGGDRASVHLGVRAVPRRPARRVARRLGARQRAGEGRAGDRGGARLSGLAGARAGVRGRVDDRPRPARRGHGGERSGPRPVPASEDAAGLLAARPVGPHEGPRDGRPAGGGHRAARSGDRDVPGPGEPPDPGVPGAEGRPAGRPLEASTRPSRRTGTASTRPSRPAPA